MKKEQHQNKIGSKTPVSTLGYLVFKVLTLLKLTSKVCEQNLKRNVLSLPYQDAVSLWKSLSRDKDLSLEFLCVDSFRFITFQLISL